MTILIIFFNNLLRRMSKLFCQVDPIPKNQTCREYQKDPILITIRLNPKFISYINLFSRQKKLKPIQNQEQRTLPLLQISQASFHQKNSPNNISHPKIKTEKQNKKEFIVKLPENRGNMKEEQFYYNSLSSNVNLKRIYQRKQKLKDISNLLVIHFEEILLINSQFIWKYYNQTINSCKLSNLEKLFFENKCEYNAFCSCNLRQNLKQTLKTLNQLYMVILIFQKQQYRKWHEYLQKNDFLYDSAYFLEKNDQPNLCSIGVNYDKILLDQGYNFNKILVMNNLNRGEQYQMKIPLIQFEFDGILNVLYLHENLLKNSTDCQQLQELAIQFNFVKENKMLLFKNEIQLQRLQMINFFKESVQKVQKIASQQKYLDEVKIQLLKYVNSDKQEKNVQLREILLVHIKTVTIDKVNNLHYLVGDLVMRNQKYQNKSNLYSTNQGNIKNIQRCYNSNIDSQIPRDQQEILVVKNINYYSVY